LRTKTETSVQHVNNSRRACETLYAAPLLDLQTPQANLSIIYLSFKVRNFSILAIACILVSCHCNDSVATSNSAFPYSRFVFLNGLISTIYFDFHKKQQVYALKLLSPQSWRSTQIQYVLRLPTRGYPGHHAMATWPITALYWAPHAAVPLDGSTLL
jgi:hypothetical protein